MADVNPEKRQSPNRIVIYNLISFVVFLIILGFLNISFDYFDNNMLLEIVNLLNSNILLIFTFSIIFTVGEVFGSFRFPSNLPSPIFNAIGSLFLLNFLFKIFNLVGNFSTIDTFEKLTKALPFLYPIIFLLVLIGGYVSILTGASQEVPPKKKTSKNEESHDRSWDDVGNEFKEMLYDVFHSARESLKGNKNN
ncbi:MAG TPA: hypothetical protein PLP47_03955 [Methanofastidiosum sp.]|nr:hypothetical protein [Methanofastidiosum sp.]HOG74066.1 hypothetical protein [Methanofastidiosum sp.]HQK63233.1 hypothetical protein [Methanofastidiosum sp.]HQM94937.1 hypothetical protein [Methanofastidiosum sp.]HQQ48671.1 hypothetical protein [Methanofastidiosum sp.]